MKDFTFDDRPDDHRLEVMKETYSEVNADLVKLFIDFQWTYRNMQKSYDQLLQSNDLSESRFIIMMFLYHAPNQTLLPSEISSKLGATRATVSKLLKGMEGKGWISKETATDDLRSFSIKLTKSGKTVLSNFLPNNFNFANSFFGALSNDEILELSFLLMKMNKSIERYNENKGEK